MYAEQKREWKKMGRFFSDKVETAIRYIYYDLGAQRG